MKTKQLQKGWEEVELREIFELKYGSSLPESRRVNGNFEVYGSNGIIGYHNKGITNGQTIIVGRKGSIGKINLSKNSCFPIDTTYYIDETKISCDTKWLFYILKKLNLELLNRSAAVPGLNRKDVYSIKIPLPPLKTQKAIVSILEKAEQLKVKRKQALEYLDEYLKSVFNEMFLKQKFEEIELGDKRITEIQGEYGSGAGAVKYNGEIRYIRITDIDKTGNLRREIVSPSIIEKKYFLQKGDLLFARSGATVGKTYLHNLVNQKYQYAGYLIRFRFNKNLVEPNYVYYYTKTSKYLGWVESIQKVVAQPNINAKQYSSLKIPLPPLELQQKFASIVEHVEKIKGRQKQSLGEIETLFNSLMQKAFRGELIK